jgi:hypothetical protein
MRGKVHDFESWDKILRRGTMFHQIETDTATCLNRPRTTQLKGNLDCCPYMTNDPEELLTLSRREVHLLSRLGKMPHFKKVGPGLV